MNLMVPELMGMLAGGMRRGGPILLAAFLLTSCNVTKYLTDEQELLTGQRVALNRADRVANRADVAYELSVLAQQRPNGNFLFLFPREHFYLANSKPRDTTSIDRFLRNTIGQPPTIYSDSLSRRSSRSMADYLRYLGYFNATAYHEADRYRRRKVRLIYHVDAGRRYLIDTVTYTSPDPVLDSILQAIKPAGELRPGTPLDLNRFDREKTRISRRLRNEGYAFFSNGYFDKLEVDTSQRSGYANLYLSILPAPRDDAYRKYRVGRISVLTDFRLTELGADAAPPLDTVIGGIEFISSAGDFSMRPELLAENIFLQPGATYSRENYEKTNVALGGLGIYRFVRINQQIDSLQPDVLNYQIQLTPDRIMALGADLDVSYTNRNGLIGPSDSLPGNLIGISLSPNFSNRNVFGGAELLTVNLRAGVELNPRRKIRDNDFFNTVDLGAETSLDLPRFRDFGLYALLRNTGLLTPTFYQQLRERATTRYSLAYEYLLIRRFYDYQIANARLGYNFRRSATTTYRINHLALDVLNFTTDDLFDDILATNERLQRSVSDQYFLSLLFRNLEFTRTGRPDRRGRSLTLNGRFELTGGEIHLTERLVGNITPANTFAQYALAVADARFYKQYDPLTSFATRFLISAGRPLVGSQVMPYVKQFFAGGANSMRAWLPRGLGPGGYVDPLSVDSTFTNLRLYQTGDFQLELNLEYRFNLFSFFRGALFTDIGNVWTLDEDRDRPGSQFRFAGKLRSDADDQPFYHQPFYRQLAIAGGLGLRVDLSYFIFRLDAAIPLRYNYPQIGDNFPLERDGTNYAERFYWQNFDDFKLNDITFQLGLGYPF